MVVLEESEYKTHFGRPRTRWRQKINMDLKKTGPHAMDSSGWGTEQVMSEWTVGVQKLWASASPVQKVLASREIICYGRITSTKSPSFCVRTFSASLTNLSALLPQSRDTSCYVSKPILVPPPLWLHKHTDLRAYGFAHSPDMWLLARLGKFTCAWSWRLQRINPIIHVIRLF